MGLPRSFSPVRERAGALAGKMGRKNVMTPYLERRTALTRYFSGKVAVQPVQNEQINDMPKKYVREREVMQTVKALFLAANPASTNRLAIDEEIRAIEQKVRAAEHRDVLSFQQAWPARPDNRLQLFNQHP